MRPGTQKRLAIAGALIGLAVFLAANAHLLTVAVQSQPSCVVNESAPAPAKPVC